MCRKKFDNRFTNKNFNVQNVFEKEFCIGKGDNKKSLTLVSGKFVNFIQTFGHLVSFYYNLVLVL